MILARRGRSASTTIRPGWRRRARGGPSWCSSGRGRGRRRCGRSRRRSGCRGGTGGRCGWGIGGEWACWEALGRRGRLGWEARVRRGCRAPWPRPAVSLPGCWTHIGCVGLTPAGNSIACSVRDGVRPELGSSKFSSKINLISANKGATDKSCPEDETRRGSPVVRECAI